MENSDMDSLRGQHATLDNVFDKIEELEALIKSLIQKINALQTDINAIKSKVHA